MILSMNSVSALRASAWIAGSFLYFAARTRRSILPAASSLATLGGPSTATDGPLQVMRRPCGARSTVYRRTRLATSSRRAGRSQKARGCLRERHEGAARYPDVRRAVEGERRDVVRAARVMEAGESLDVLTAHAKLELAAAVEDHAGGLDALDAVQQSAQRPEARRLDVQIARPRLKRLDVRPRV